MSFGDTDTLSESDTEARTSARETRPFLFLCMECERPQAGGARFALTGLNEVSIGRAESRTAHVHQVGQRRTLALGIPDARISSLHATLEVNGSSVTLRDGGSKNGVLVSGQRVQRAALHDGAVIELGRSLLVYRRAIPCGAQVDAFLDAEPLLASSQTEQVTLLPWLHDAQARTHRLFAEGLPLLVQGETGTGKEQLALALHKDSERRGDFVAINCGALPPDLVESELFGFRRGTFSGATEHRTGLVRAADQGTLFLDEIGDLPLVAQTALLRVLQEGEVLPIGATSPIKVDLRVIAATHRDLRALVDTQSFRLDLYSRVSGSQIVLPPLRERKEDLGILVGNILKRLRGRSALPSLSLGFCRALLAATWPMNVRELELALRHAWAVADSAQLTQADLPEGFGLAKPAQSSLEHLSGEERRTREHLVTLLTQTGGNISEVARRMGKARTQVQRWIRRFNIT